MLPYAGCNDEMRKKITVLARTLEDGLIELGRKSSPLSPREQEVLLLLREGLTNPMIAKRLRVSLSTVKAAVSSILSKKGVSSREMLKDRKTKK